MQPVFIPAPHNHILKGVKEQVKVCDYQGNVLGYFTPAEGAEPRVPCEPPPLSDEEIERIENDPREYTTEEVIAELENFPCSP